MIHAIRSFFARRSSKHVGSSSANPTQAELTPFFASIDSYVALAEQVPLTLLSELMTAYFDACMTAVETEGGTIDKIVGDVLVARFGGPRPTHDHAFRACLAALKCQAHVDELRERLSRDGSKWPEPVRQLRVRIGLHSGVALLGNLGSERRFSFTMMGDDVNLAARMEKLAKQYGVWTLCTEPTRNGSEQAEPDRIIFRSLGRVIVKGRASPLELFEPITLRETASAQLHECVGVFEKGLDRLRAQDWDNAITLFATSARLERLQPGTAPGVRTNPSLIFADMAQTFRNNPDTQPLVV